MRLVLLAPLIHAMVVVLAWAWLIAQPWDVVARQLYHLRLINEVGDVGIRSLFDHGELGIAVGSSQLGVGLASAWRLSSRQRLLTIIPRIFWILRSQILASRWHWLRLLRIRPIAFLARLLINVGDQGAVATDLNMWLDSWITQVLGIDVDQAHVFLRLGVWEVVFVVLWPAWNWIASLLEWIPLSRIDPSICCLLLRL